MSNASLFARRCLSGKKTIENSFLRAFDSSAKDKIKLIFMQQVVAHMAIIRAVMGNALRVRDTQYQITTS